MIGQSKKKLRLKHFNHALNQYIWLNICIFTKEKIAKLEEENKSLLDETRKLKFQLEQFKNTVIPVHAQVYTVIQQIEHVSRVQGLAITCATDD